MSNMSEEEIKEMYEKGIVQIAPMMELLIEKYKEDKFNLDIQQCQILIHYLLNEREFDENYIDELENEIDKEKEKNRIMKAEFERLENIEDDTAQLKLLLKEEKEKNKNLIDSLTRRIEYTNELEAIRLRLTIENNKLHNSIQDYISKDKLNEIIKKQIEEANDVLIEKEFIDNFNGSKENQKYYYDGYKDATLFISELLEE